MLLPFTYFAFPYFLSFFQTVDDLSYADGDRCHVVPHGGECRRKARCRNRPFAVPGLQEPSFVEHGLPAGLDERIFQQRIEQDNHMPQVVYPDMKALLAGKESFHILDAHRNRKQMVSIGTRHNTCHLFTAEVAAERKRRSVYQLLRPMLVRSRQRFGHVVHPYQFSAFLR